MALAGNSNEHYGGGIPGLLAGSRPAADPTTGRSEAALDGQQHAREPKDLAQRIEMWPIERLVPYANNPRKNDAAVDRMCDSLREFGFKIPCLVRSDGEVVDGHLRLKAARKLGIQEIPVILCDEWGPAQVKAFRLLVNRSASWADWDEELLAVELQEIQEADFDLSLTGFDPGELDQRLLGNQDDRANEAPPVPQSPVSRLGDLWLLGRHRVLCGDATSAEAVGQLLGESKPRLMVTDPPYGIELDSEWRDRAGLNGCGPAEPSYLKRRIAGHTQTTISGDTRADWSEVFALVPSLDVAYVWHASRFTREVLEGLLRIGFVHHQQIIWNKGRTVLTRSITGFSMSPAGTSARKTHRGTGRPERTPPSGIRPARNLLWADRTRISSITPRRSPWN